ncbi:MAG: DNA mismatch repair endonuclease MutL [Bacilli bacterium]|nr:DNA mismatch repair endonuclease MutL [Bacilli bacterium]
MAKIKIMSDGLANKIAAGEVVEKTMNVVKELVENSIDASSSRIEIELIDAGVKEIKVRDDGKGMGREDATLAFSRHATSKLIDIEDLFNIESLGFRGEALPSIAAVSKIELITSNEKEGTKIHINGGEILDISSSDLGKGTSIIVKDLFYNTPVRLKYLKNLYIELAAITEYINKMALAYPAIQFSLTNNGKNILKTTGDRDLLKVIYHIYGVETAKKMIEICGENDDYYISGYISYPEVARSNRNAITTLVNGRVIKNNRLNKVITDAYHTYIPKEKYPIIILNIDVDPILVDINIHPTKMDIKFSKFDELEKLLTTEIVEKLEKLLLIPNVSVRDSKTVEEVNINAQLSDIETELENSQVEKKADTTYEEMILDFEVQENTKDEGDLPVRIKKMTPKGIVYSTYIIAENEDGMYIIDQHAAAERINYEKVLKEITKENPIILDLLVPVKIELPSNEYLILKQKFEVLTRLGFAIEEFGFNTILIRSHPNWIKEGYEEEDIKRVIDIMICNEKFNLDKFVWRISATQACRMSIKANDYINYEDQVYLLDSLRECENPFTCPHGRPTIITYTKYDLEKLFKRTMD